MRPDWEVMGLSLAALISQRSSDQKVQVGAVIISNKTRKVVSMGYNGRAAGESNKREHMDQGYSGFLHAEANALMRSGGNWAWGEEHTLYCTHEPCAECARHILNSGHIKSVVFIRPYAQQDRLDRGLPRGREILEEGGVWVGCMNFDQRLDAFQLMQETAQCIHKLGPKNGGGDV